MSRQASFRVRFGSRSALFVPIVAILFCCASLRSFGDDLPDILTNAADVLSLTAEQAGHHVPTVVRGVVTVAETDWEGEFFLQDASSGVFVEGRENSGPEPGDVVEVHGFTRKGAFAPTVAKQTWEKVGTAPLPKAKRVSPEQLMSGLEDGQRVEVTGMVRSAGANKVNMDLELASGGYRIHVFPKRVPGLDPQSLVGARVRVRGTAAASWNAQLRHLLDVIIFVPSTNDFEVVQMEKTNPFDEPIIPLTGTAEYRRDIQPGQRVHVKGVVTLQRPGQDLFLQDEKWGLRVQTRQTNHLAVGDVVEAVGFPDVDNFLPVLGNAVFRKTSDKMPMPEPKKVDYTEITNVLHHAGLVTLDAKLLDGSARLSQTVKGSTTITLLLQAEGLPPFTATGEFPDGGTKLTAIPIGSTIEITGICFTQNGKDRNFQSLQLLLPNADNVKILAQPSWFTPKRLFVGVGILAGVLVLVMSWSVMVSKRNSVLRVLIRDREKAQFELQEAHDQLEERVKERTAQLKFQTTARKESELQFKATLKERTRLAQELHDTLEQTLTGIALQLDTTSKLFESRPENANHHLELARGLVNQSQVDVRRSVWDLRSRALEQFDLPGALSTSGKQLTDGTNIHLEVSARGRVRPLPEIVEENLLRIAQEALTNVIKHSQATEVSIELDYGPQNIVLEVKDNGRGFEREKTVGPGQGHFGLLGISERAKRLGAQLDVTSQNGHGTLVRIQVPLEENAPAPELASSEAVI